MSQVEVYDRKHLLRRLRNGWFWIMALSFVTWCESLTGLPQVRKWSGKRSSARSGNYITLIIDCAIEVIIIITIILIIIIFIIITGKSWEILF